MRNLSVRLVYGRRSLGIAPNAKLGEAYPFRSATVIRSSVGSAVAFAGIALRWVAVCNTPVPAVGFNILILILIQFAYVCKRNGHQ
jgi:hypothetical protein